MKKSTLYGALAAVGAAAVSLTGASVYFYNVAFRRNPPKGINKIVPMEPAPEKVPTRGDVRFSECLKENDAWIKTVHTSLVSTRSEDGLLLYGTLITNPSGDNKTALLVHGFHGDTRSFVGYDRFLYALGYSLLIVENRAHGRSEGKWLGMGHEDRRDIVRWCKKIIHLQGEDVKIILHGVSMGGAAVMEASGEADLPPQVKCIIEDCGFSSMEEQFSSVFPQSLSFIKSPVIALASGISRVNRGYFFREADASRAVMNARVPMLFIHGEKDDFVPTEMVYRVYRTCKAEKSLLIVPKGEHFNSYWTNETMYRNAVETFLNRYV